MKLLTWKQSGFSSKQLAVFTCYSSRKHREHHFMAAKVWIVWQLFSSRAISQNLHCLHGRQGLDTMQSADSFVLTMLRTILWPWQSPLTLRLLSLYPLHSSMRWRRATATVLMGRRRCAQIVGQDLSIWGTVGEDQEPSFCDWLSTLWPFFWQISFRWDTSGSFICWSERTVLSIALSGNLVHWIWSSSFQKGRKSWLAFVSTAVWRQSD